MNTTGYTVLGWVVWQVGSRIAKRKLRQNRVKIAAAGGVIAAVVVGGALLGRSRSSEQD